MLVANLVAALLLIAMHAAFRTNDFHTGFSDLPMLFIALCAPALLGMKIATSRSAMWIVAAAQALSPLTLLPDQLQGNSQNMAILTWWFLIPVVVALIVVTDAFVAAIADARPADGTTLGFGRRVVAAVRALPLGTKIAIPMTAAVFISLFAA